MGLFDKAFKDLDTAMKKSAVQALNKTATSTRAKFAQEVSKTVGLASTKAKGRVKIYKASGNSLGVVISIGTREAIAAQDLAPRRIKVMSSKGARYGANFLIKTQGRQVATAGVLAKAPNGKNIVVTRIGNSNTFKTVKVPELFLKSVMSLKTQLEKHMTDTFNKTFDSQMAYNIKK